MRPLVLLGIAAILTLSGCQTNRQTYYWGNYETINYLAYSKPDKAPLDLQREKLEEDIEKARGHGLAAHPGLHAQLGYVYFQLGRGADAVAEFQKEKDLFPESATLMDRMIGQAQGGTAK